MGCCSPLSFFWRYDWSSCYQLGPCGTQVSLSQNRKTQPGGERTACQLCAHPMGAGNNQNMWSEACCCFLGQAQGTAKRHSSAFKTNNVQMSLCIFLHIFIKGSSFLKPKILSISLHKPQTFFFALGCFPKCGSFFPHKRSFLLSKHLMFCAHVFLILNYVQYTLIL